MKWIKLTIYNVSISAPKRRPDVRGEARNRERPRIWGIDPESSSGQAGGLTIERAATPGSSPGQAVPSPSRGEPDRRNPIFQERSGNNRRRAGGRVHPPEPVAPPGGVELIDAIESEQGEGEPVERPHAPQEGAEQQPVGKEEEESEIEPLHPEAQYVGRAVGEHQRTEQDHRQPVLRPQGEQARQAGEADPVPGDPDQHPDPIGRRPRRLASRPQLPQRIAAGAEAFERSGDDAEEEGDCVGHGVGFGRIGWGGIGRAGAHARVTESR